MYRKMLHIPLTLLVAMKPAWWTVATLTGVLLTAHLTSAAQDSRSRPTAIDSLNIHFRLDSVRVDMDFADNRARWQHFLNAFRQRYADKGTMTLSLDIYSGASPEGTAAHNRWLGENRGSAIRRLIRATLGDSIGAIRIHNEGARWDAFYDMIALSGEPWRDEVLDIVNRTPDANEQRRDYRETMLRKMRGGTVWPVLLDKYLSPLRSGATAILTFDNPNPCDEGIGYGGQQQPPPATGDDTPPAMDVAVTGGDTPADTAPEKTKQQRTWVRRPAWILRTNMPLLGILAPNLQAEWSLGHRDRWSLNIEAIGPWWVFAHNAYANELLFGAAELRYWLGNRQHHHTLDGWHIGLAAGGGYGDVEWRSRGYQFEAATTYINIGWQHRFGRRRQWAFDAGIGLGALYAPYRRYEGSTLFPEGRTERYDDHLMWQETRHLNWIGTPHANISIGYVFQTAKGLYRRQKAAARDSIATAIRMRRYAVRDSMRQERDRFLVKWYALPKKERKRIMHDYRHPDKQKHTDTP